MRQQAKVLGGISMVTKGIPKRTTRKRDDRMVQYTADCTTIIRRESMPDPDHVHRLHRVL